jgi:hypothetical protein
MFEDKWKSDIWKIYITSLEENVLLLCGTDESFIRETLNRMDSGAQRQALPESRPESKYVDRQAQVWAIRHYDKGSSPNDPSSPLSGYGAPYSVPDSEAFGLVMSFDPGRTKEIKVKYLSSNPDALTIVKEYWEYPDYVKPLIRTHGVGAIEISSAERASGPFVLLLLGALGHGLLHIAAVISAHHDPPMPRSINGNHPWVRSKSFMNNTRAWTPSRGKAL